MIRGSCEGRKRNRDGVAGVEAETQRRTGAAKTREGVAARTCTIGGATCTD